MAAWKYGISLLVFNIIELNTRRENHFSARPLEVCLSTIHRIKKPFGISVLRNYSMGVSTLSNRTVKFNRSDTEDNKREKPSAKTVKPQEIITSTTTTTTTKPTEPPTKASTTMPTLKRETTEKPQPANQQRCMRQHNRPQ
mgnify:CR=1 FL=1